MNTNLDRAKSPASNTGILTTEIKLDYLSFTIPFEEDSIGRVLDMCDTETLTELSYGGMGYLKSALLLDGGRIFWHPDRLEMGVHVRLNSNSLGLLSMTPIGLLRRVVDMKGKFTRMDIAMDDTAGLLDMDEMHRKLVQGEVVTRWKKVIRIKGQEVGKVEKRGDTVNVGSRQSQSFLRIYDKKLEMRTKGVDVSDIEHWVRVELELKAEKANVFGIMLADTAPGKQPLEPGKLCVNLIWGMIDFKDENPFDDNKSRWNTSVFWEKFLQASSKLKLSIPKNPKTLDDSKEWIWEAVAPTLAMIVLAREDEKGDTGYDFIVDCLVKGAERMSKAQQMMLDVFNWSHHQNEEEGKLPT